MYLDEVFIVVMVPETILSTILFFTTVAADFAAFWVEEHSVDVGRVLLTNHDFDIRLKTVAELGGMGDGFITF